VTFPSSGSPEFWKTYYRLPEAVRVLARKNYRLWQANPFHPSLVFKKVGGENWSVRIGAHYRAIGKFVEDGFLWEWIGTHGDYDRLA
jgi:hypothetical protein